VILNAFFYYCFYEQNGTFVSIIFQNVMLLKSNILLLFLCLFTFKQVNGQSLKNAFKKDFLIGVAINQKQIEETETGSTGLITKHFNSLSPENALKARYQQPTWNNYDFSLGDKYIAFAQKHKLKPIGHTLIWHEQMPFFLQKIQSADSVRLYIQQHIGHVAGHYAGKLMGWDVVNEALNEDGTYRKSIFFDTLGEQFLVEAFKAAQAADPSAQLYYNEYNNEYPGKREGCIRIIKLLQTAGVRLDAIGIQAHYTMGKVPFKELEESILAFAKLGVKIHITELDLAVMPSTGPNLYPDGLPENIAKQQAEEYKKLFQLFKKHKKHIERVTFWGLHDGASWLNNRRKNGHTEYPLLFDRNLNEKAFIEEIIKK
jgi:endo-1,4-beta-xylanase